MDGHIKEPGVEEFRAAQGALDVGVDRFGRGSTRALESEPSVREVALGGGVVG
jgi:hypothetical protein